MATEPRGHSGYSPASAGLRLELLAILFREMRTSREALQPLRTAALAPGIPRAVFQTSSREDVIPVL